MKKQLKDSPYPFSNKISSTSNASNAVINVYIFSFLRQSTLQCYRGTVECIFSCIYFCEHIITHYYRKKK